MDAREMSDPACMLEMTSQEFSCSEALAKCVFVPFAQVEAHGPHLPLGTDVFSAGALAERLSARTGCLAAPVIPLGCCLDFACWPGYIVVETRVFISLVESILESLAEQGARTVVLFTPHPGNVFNALVAAMEGFSRKQPQMRLAAFNFSGLGSFYKDFAGEGSPDSSLMLYLDKVKARLPEMQPGPPGWFWDGRYAGPGLTLNTFFPSAFFGDPRASTFEDGYNILEHAVSSLAAIIDAMTS